MSWIEIVAALFGFVCVVLTIRRNVWCWPVGLVQVLLYIVVFYHAKLYSDLLLHVIYVVLQFYGWYCWLARADTEVDGSLSVNTLSVRTLSGWLAVTATGTLLLGYGMATWTDASLPYGDAFTTVASLVAQFLLARKLVENWLFWIVVDLVAIGIYTYKSLYPTAVLYSAFLVLAIIGLLAWRRCRTRQAAAEENLA